MQYGKYSTDQAEQDFRAYYTATTFHAWTETRQQLEKNMKQLFWTAVLYRKGKKTELVVPPETVLAESEAKARVAAIKEIPSSFTKRFDRLEVVVRPF